MHNTTPAFLLLLIILCLAVLFVKKENIIYPFVAAMCFLPADIAVTIGPLHFYALRFLAIFGFFRILSIKTKPLSLNTIDILFITENISRTLIYCIASQDTLGAIINQSGIFVDSIVLYLIFRYVIESKEDIEKIVKSFNICIIVLLPFILVEFITGHNLFSILGRSSIAIRNGEIRAAGTFSHSILFGSFAAALFPMLWAEYKSYKKNIFLLGVGCCLFFVYSCSSSGPILALASSICLLFFFKWKQFSTQLSWTIFGIALFIHLVREKPLWHFIFVRISVKASSTGVYRYQLIDAAVKEFWNWWLTGYGDLGPQWHEKYWPWAWADFTDVTNQYLIEGVRGGFFSMLLFIILCYKVIKTLGSCAISQHAINNQWLYWGFTVMMITHCISFLSVSYFGQITMLLYLNIAISAYVLDQNSTPPRPRNSELKSLQKT